MTPLDGPCCEQHFINQCNVKYQPYGSWGHFLEQCTLKLITLSLRRLRCARNAAAARRKHSLRSVV